MILVEITAATDSVGTLQTFYLSDAKFITQPTDTPPNIAFEPSLKDPGFIGIHAFSDGATGGLTKLETGEIVISNIDGQYDAWLNYSFDGRPCVIRYGANSGAYPGAFTRLLNCTIESIEMTFKQIVVRIRDFQYLFSLPVASTLYAGTNALPNGIEGTANDLKGKPKPVMFGEVFNATPAFVNTSKLVYQVNNGQVVNISAVFDRGQALTQGADYATNALLLGASPTAGTYITCVSEGLFRLGSSPSGLITFNGIQGSTAANRTAGQIIKALAVMAGVSTGNVSAADVTALGAANPAPVGIYIADNQSFAAAMDMIAQSVGAYYGFDGNAVLRMGVLTLATGTAVATLHNYDILEGIERRPPKDNGIAVYSVAINHSRIFTVQASDLAGSVTDAQIAYLANQYRTELATDATVKVKSLLAELMERDTLLTTQSAAALEAARLLAMYKTPRSLFDVPVHISYLSSNTFNFLDVIDIVLNRFGCNAGRSFRFVGLRMELAKSRAILTLWG